MKQIAVIVLSTLFLCTAGFAQLTLGVDAGVSIILEDTDPLDDDVNRISIPAYLEVGYQLPTTFNLGNLGESSIIVGGRAGFLNGTKAEGKLMGVKTEASWYTIPIYIFGRAEAGRIFTDIGIGLHAWNITLETEETEIEGISIPSNKIEDNGLDFTAELKTGLNFNLSEKASLRVGISLQSLSFDDSDGVFALGTFVGTSFKF